MLRNWSIVRGGTSSAQKALFFNLRRLRAKLAKQAGVTDVFKEIATALGVARADVEIMDARLSGPDISLNAPVGDSDPSVSSERVDFLSDGGPLQDEVVGATIDGVRHTRWLNDALGHLSERELRILRERRLVDDAATLESLGARMGISKERVRQIESRAIEKLKLAMSQRSLGMETPAIA